MKYGVKLDKFSYVVVLWYLASNSFLCLTKKNWRKTVLIFLSFEPSLAIFHAAHFLYLLSLATWTKANSSLVWTK